MNGREKKRVRSLVGRQMRKIFENQTKGTGNDNKK